MNTAVIMKQLLILELRILEFVYCSFLLLLLPRYLWLFLREGWTDYPLMDNPCLQKAPSNFFNVLVQYCSKYLARTVRLHFSQLLIDRKGSDEYSQLFQIVSFVVLKVFLFISLIYTVFCLLQALDPTSFWIFSIFHQIVKNLGESM